VLKRNRIDARAVCQIGRSNGFSPDPIVLLRNPGFPRPGFLPFQRCSPVATRSVSRSCRRAWRLDESSALHTDAREVPLLDVPRIPARNLRRADPWSTRFLFRELPELTPARRVGAFHPEADRPAKTPPCPSPKGLRNRWIVSSSRSAPSGSPVPVPSVVDDRCPHRRVGRKRGGCRIPVGTIPGILCGFPSMRNFKMGLFAETAPIPQRYPLLRYEIRALGRAKNPSFSPIYLPLPFTGGSIPASTRPTARRLRPTSP